MNRAPQSPSHAHAPLPGERLPAENTAEPDFGAEFAKFANTRLQNHNSILFEQIVWLRIPPRGRITRPKTDDDPSPVTSPDPPKNTYPDGKIIISYFSHEGPRSPVYNPYGKIQTTAPAAFVPRGEPPPRGGTTPSLVIG